VRLKKAILVLLMGTAAFVIEPLWSMAYFVLRVPAADEVISEHCSHELAGSTRVPLRPNGMMCSSERCSRAPQ